MSRPTGSNSSDHATGRRNSSVARTAALIFLNTLLILGTVELAAIGINRYWPVDTSNTEARVATGASIPYYARQSWSEAFWREHVRQVDRNTRFHPFVMWRSAPFTGKHINIDQDGFRRTVNPSCDDDAYKVFMFGGSTMWGWGAPDWGTIASYLSELLAKTRRSVCVSNFGQNAFVSTQELMELIRQLQTGNIPDLVIFYDGFNDAHATWQTGVAGHHYRAGLIAGRIEGKGDASRPGIGSLLQRSASFTLFRRLFPVRSVKPAEPSKPVDPQVRQDLADRAMDVYLANYRTVEALSRAYAFRFGFFWQPCLDLGGKSFTVEEQEMANDPRVVNSLPFLEALYGRIQTAAEREAGLFYLGRVFDDVDSQIWIDFAHVTPEGNRLLAMEMIERLGLQSAANKGATDN